MRAPEQDRIVAWFTDRGFTIEIAEPQPAWPFVLVAKRGPIRVYGFGHTFSRALRDLRKQDTARRLGAPRRFPEGTDDTEPDATLRFPAVAS